MVRKFTSGKIISILVAIYFITPKLVYGQCGCDTTIGKNVYKFDGSKILPGKTICLSAGIQTQNLAIQNLNGTPNNKIIIKNCGGQTIFKLTDSTSFGLKFQFSKNFRVTGTGSSDFYGIVIDRAHIGLPIGDFSSDFEVDHLEIKKSGFAGVMAKTDNSGRGTFVMKNVSFHHNYVHNTGSGEGFYIGNTSWTVNGNQHDIDSIEVYNNITDSTGSDGLQVGCTYSGNAKIYNNQITNTGVNPFANYQSNGVQLGNGFSGRFYNNYIQNPGSNGVSVFGPGNVYVYNNVIVNVHDIGIYSGRNTAEAGKYFNYLHNTIIMSDSSKVPAIKFDPVVASRGYVYNNAVVRRDTTTTPTFNRASSTWDVKGNVVRTSINDFNFKNPAARDYDLLPGSPAINAGVAVDSFGINFDYAYRQRPVGKYDAGAYEFQGPFVLYRVNAGGLEIADSVLNWTKDKQNEPCPWLDPASSYYTTGSDLPWTGTNTTDAPKQIFSTNRFAGNASRPQVNYNFPVSNGAYEVRLYFAENNYQAPGQRVFDVAIEGATKLADFDIYSTAGYRNAFKASFIVNVTDGILDVDFIQKTGNPQINGIAVLLASSANAPTTNKLLVEKQTVNTNTVLAYPVPMQDRIYVQKKRTGTSPVSDKEEVEVTLFNETGTQLYKAKHWFTGGSMNAINFSPLHLNTGVYIMRLKGKETNEAITLLKQ